MRSLRPDKALQLSSASLGFIGLAPPDFAPLAVRLRRQSGPLVVRVITALILSSYFGRCRSKKAQITAGPFGSLGAGPKNRG